MPGGAEVLASELVLCISIGTRHLLWVQTGPRHLGSGHLPFISFSPANRTNACQSYTEHLSPQATALAHPASASECPPLAGEYSGRDSSVLSCL